VRVQDQRDRLVAGADAELVVGRGEMARTALSAGNMRVLMSMVMRPITTIPRICLSRAARAGLVA
jgi:hypothetical protein